MPSALEGGETGVGDKAEQEADTKSGSAALTGVVGFWTDLAITLSLQEAPPIGGEATGATGAEVGNLRTKGL
eukprot:CAMPEP_0115338560 /NCGR_PEP_ID=MMETSP0270-20121206/90141_1 /TAXON_ID=71861 /ORGANISM="Scrippsiella trochoidea, Strain CCMP3099" /LENGTH=71 /DNA_ID=CAMNT_0002759881 /DNA_START=48 /DNA_END=263 /DNA_ORIENTATION=-